MVNMTNIFIGFVLFFVGQAMIWFQTNSQFIWKWPKDHPFIMAMCGIPISYLLIIATKYVVNGFGGILWPGRLIGFGAGMIVMAICTYFMMGEGITNKTAVSLVLAITLVLIQVFWK